MSLAKCMAFVLLLLVSPVHGKMLNIVVDKAHLGGIPIVINKFANQPAELTDLAAIIKTDLNFSGQFQLTDTISKAHNLVAGSITPTGSKYQVQFELLDNIKSTKPLLHMKFDNIAAEHLRALSHHIADLIFEHLIGVKGIFSTKIAYVTVHSNQKTAEHALEIADIDGANSKVLLRQQAPLMSPAWSPNAKKIAFVSFERNRAAINIIDVVSRKVEKISSFPGINGAPSWSPDGRSLALVLSKDGHPKIYQMELASKQLTQLTDGVSIDTEPSYTPDGNFIVFTSNRSGKPQIYKVSVNGGRPERLTFSGDYNAKPTITRDGKYLVMLHKRHDDYGIAVQNLENNSLQLLTKTSMNDSPTVAPNGMMVLYGTELSGKGVLSAVSIDGQVNIRLPAHDSDVQEPAWAPFTN